MTNVPQAADRAETIQILARQAIGVFDSGSGGMVTAAWLVKLLKDARLDSISVVFFGDTANLPYGTKTQEQVAQLSDAIIERLSSHCPVLGIACNTASASWAHFGSVGKDGGPRQPKVFSVIDVAAQQAYDRARVLLDPKMKRGRKTVGVLGTELTAEIQSHAERIVDLHRIVLSEAIGHELPLVPYTFGRNDIEPTLPPALIDYHHTPHIAVFRDDEPGPGGTTRAGVRHWTPPSHLAHDVEIIARAAQKLVAAVDVAHILDAEGRVKAEWREELASYLHEVSRDLVQRKATALILGCTHFEFFEQEFTKLLPTLAARNAIISPSGALAVALLDAFGEYADAHPVQPIGRTGRSYFAFSGDRPPPETFQGLGITSPVYAARI
jgi:glutamate racemase